jgi:hypothetical protein
MDLGRRAVRKDDGRSVQQRPIHGNSPGMTEGNLTLRRLASMSRLRDIAKKPAVSKDLSKMMP